MLGGSIHRRTFVIALTLGLIIAMQPSAALADPGGPGSPGNAPPTGAPRPNQPFTVHIKDPATCTGFSYGGSTQASTAWGAAYQDCEGNVVYQSADVHLLYCISTITGLCWPYWDLGSMTNGTRTFYGPGGFWTPQFGNATMGGLTPGYSYMVRTHHAVLTSDGTGGDGYSSSAIFQSR